MKMNRYILMALIVLSVSCERTTFLSEPKIIASFEAVAEKPEKTKVAISEDYVLSWEEGDRVLINDGSVSKLFLAQSKGSSTVFSAEGMVIVDDKTYVAAYPESAAVFYEGDLKVTVSETFAATPGTYPSAPAVALGNGKDKKLDFKNICALISFNVTGSNVTSVKIEGAKGETLAGLVTVDPYTAEYTIADEDRKDKIVLTSAVNALFPGKYYVPVLPGEFEEGILVTLTMSDAENNLVREFDPVVLERSKYIDLEKLDAGRFVRYEISTAAQLKEFLEDAPKCKPYVTATLMDDVDVQGVELPSAESYAGSFDGQGFAIKNWTSSSPLFKTLNAGATVKDLVLHSTCTLTLAETEVPYQSFVVAHNLGTVTGCVNKAAVNYTASALNARVFGTIVGFNAGNVKDCHNEGDFNLILSGASADQSIAGVVGAFASTETEEAVKNCTNKGNLAVGYTGTLAGKTLNVAGVCASAFNSEAESVANVGTLRLCTNNGKVSLTLAGEQTDGTANVAGVAADMQATIQECENTGEVSFVAENAFDHNVGGVAAVAVAGNIHSNTNSGAVTLNATATGTSTVGGIVAKAGAAAENTSYNIKDCVNSGALTAEVSAANLDMGGVVGWTSMPVLGSDANKLKNEGAVLAEKIATGDVNLGGVIGKSISTFDKLYTTAASSVTLNLADTWNKTMRVGGVAGHMAKEADGVFKQAQNNGAVTVAGGKSGNTNKCCIGGCIGRGEAKSVTSNSTSWVTCNTNYAKITVDSPSIVYVGGVVGYAGKGSGLGSSFQRCKNGGDIEVISPADNSCVGGIYGYQNRGLLGNANGYGQASDKVSIKVTGATSKTYVGAYVGWMYSDHGKASDHWYTMRLSGCGVYGSIDAEGATAGVLAGRLQWSGKSTSNCILLGSNADERPNISWLFVLNGVKLGDLIESNTQTENTFFGLISPSNDAAMTHIGPDGVAMKGRYLFFAAGSKTTPAASYMDGFKFAEKP
jgi:hypothetical protein